MKHALPLLSACALLAASALRTPAAAADWPMFGNTPQNLSDNPFEQGIFTFSVNELAPKWIATTGASVSARAAVVSGVAYFPDWAGNIYALNVQNGQAIWHTNLQSYGFVPGTISRTSPVVAGGTVYIGTLTGAYLVALDAATGKLKWLTQLDSNAAAALTGSAALSDGVLYTGVSSTEEFLTANPNYVCCSFRGSVVAVNAANGKIVWKTFTVPTGYTGGAAWGSNPVVDTTRQTIYIGTGNNYTTPTDPAYRNCISGGGTMTKCFSKEDHFDSMLALDLKTGAIKASRRLSSSDDWNVACTEVAGGVGECPVNPGPDADFGSAPQEITAKLPSGGTRTIIGAGQKNGIYSAFDPDTLKLIWAKQVGPGSFLGGMEWGSASDGKRIYVAVANFNNIAYKGGTAGSWSALDPANGAVLWRTPDPNASIDLGPLAVANGVVYAPSMAGGATQANMFALNADNGQVLWSYPSGGSVIAGATIVDSVVFWGSGYTNLGIPGYTGNTKFYAFSLGGH